MAYYNRRAQDRLLSAMLGELGVTEMAGDLHNPRILEYLATTGIGQWGRSRDETPWCAALVNWCFSQAGLVGLGSARARDWLRYGVPLPVPVRGCLVILRRGWRGGHIGLYSGVHDATRIMLAGGNQGNRVSLHPYPAQRVLGYRGVPA